MKLSFKVAAVLIVLAASLFISTAVLADETKPTNDSKTEIIIIPDASYFYHIIPRSIFKNVFQPGFFNITFPDGTMVVYYGNYTHVYIQNEANFEAYKVKYGLDKLTEITGNRD